MGRFRSHSELVQFATIFLVLGAVVTLEILTGREVSVAQLYLVPIAMAVFTPRRRAGLVVCSLSIGVGWAVDMWRLPSTMSAGVPAWNWAIRGAGFLGFAALLTNLCERVTEQAALARTDPLTGAVNRLGFRELLSSKVAHAAGDDLALAYVDLDGFKQVNDRQGHDVGDEILVRVAETARAALRTGDLVFRLGGDEFAWVLPGANREQAREVAERVLAAWRSDAARRQWPVTLSIGIATLAPGASVDALVREADAAMYGAKKAGGDRVVMAEPAPHAG